MPLSSMMCAAAMGAIVMLAPAESVKLKASTMPLRASASLNKVLRSVPLGGFNSEVTTKRLDFRTSENVVN